MMTLILPEKESQINNVMADPTSSGGAILIRMGLDGTCSAQILADESDEADQLRERLTAARPLLELLKNVVRAE